MSDVNARDLRKVEKIEDVLHTYEGAGDAMKTGVEVELAFFDPKSEDLSTMSVCQNKVVKNAANARCGGDFVRNEPTSEMLEVGGEAAGIDDIPLIMRNTQSRIERLTDKAAEIGLKRSYFQHLPDKTAQDLLKNLMDVARYQAFFGPPREDMQAVAAYFSVCKSNQVSVSYRDNDHLLHNIRRLYTLAPFLFLITDNNAPFNEAQSFKGHAGMMHRHSLLARGGVPPYVFTAKTGDEYIHAHINHVMNNPLFVYYNEDGELVRLPSGSFTSFNALRDKGLNTATNYYFSESILWPDVKIAALKDAEEQVFGHRYEARMFGVGLHQHQTALLITAALAFDDIFANDIDQLLRGYGFDFTDPNAMRPLINDAYANAREHGGKFLDIPFGTGRMSEFAKEFADTIERAPLMQSYESDLGPLLAICRSGYTDSKVNAILFDTLNKATEFQRSFDPDIFKNPQQCAYQLFEKDLGRQTGGRIFQSRGI